MFYDTEYIAVFAVFVQNLHMAHKNQIFNVLANCISRVQSWLRAITYNRKNVRNSCFTICTDTHTPLHNICEALYMKNTSVFILICGREL